MKEIKLTRGFVAAVDDEDFDRLSNFRWHVIFPSPRCKTPYATRTIPGNAVMMHHELLGRVRVDHIDGNGLNNQKANLRICSQQQNSFNGLKRTQASSRFKGVSWNKRRQEWQAYICPDGRKIHLGYHPTEDAAAIAYNIEAVRRFGEFARVNEGISC